jgi:glycerophosphoryl diester phosphodiesterase
MPKIIAHRGGRKWAPENTLAAFRASLEFGADGIELDVQRCASGELVVFHDEDLNRTTNGVGLVKDCSFAELRKLSAGSWFDKRFADERVPLLSEVLDLVAGKMTINIELKNAPVEYPHINDDLLQAISGYPQETLLISSFDHKLMKDLRKLAPQLKIALLAAAVFVDLKEAAIAIGATWFNPAYDCLRPDIAEEARAAKLPVNVWTCNTREEWRNCVEMNVESIITDDPAGCRAFLELSAREQKVPS